MELLSTKSAARYLSDPSYPLAFRTLERWRLEGKGPKFVKVGRKVFYRRQDLDAYLESRLCQVTFDRRKRS
jgi:hypothetical protein